MSVVARRIASVPVRTAVGSWERILELVSSPNCDARDELLGVTSVAAMLIADEQTKEHPVTVAGGGPLVRIYTLHGDDAIEHDADDETELAFNPTNGAGWTLTLPSCAADFATVQDAVSDAPHVEVRNVDEEARDEGATTKSAAAAALEFDLSALERP